MRVADFILTLAIFILGHQPELHRLGQLHQLVLEFLVGVNLAAMIVHAEILDVLAHLWFSFLVALAGGPFAQVGWEIDHLDVEVGQGKFVGVADACGVGIVKHVEVAGQFLQLGDDGRRKRFTLAVGPAHHMACTIHIEGVAAAAAYREGFPAFVLFFLQVFFLLFLLLTL